MKQIFTLKTSVLSISTFLCSLLLLSNSLFANADSLSEGLSVNCADWIQSKANAHISVGVEITNNVIGSETEFVNVTYIVVNTGMEPLKNIDLTGGVRLHNGVPINDKLNLAFAGDPNNNRQLDVNEVWLFTAKKSLIFDRGDTFVFTAGVTGDALCGQEIGAGAGLVFTSGINMDVQIDQDCVEPGDKIDVSLITRLLIDEDAAKEPGSVTIIVGGVPITIDLPASQWEARDMMITATMLNGGAEFDPFNPPAGVVLTNFCDQGADAGRNTNNVLDECDPIETVKAPCVNFGEDDAMCEYPEWVFCYCITIPEDYTEEEFSVIATDDYELWKADETEPGTGVFGAFANLTGNIATGATDTTTIEVKIVILPVDLVSFEARQQNKTTALSWQTATEINNSHFNIERSVDGVRFEVIGKVSGNGNTTSISDYKFVDDAPLPGINYYRLAQFDFDGSMERSEVRTVDFNDRSDNAKLDIFPNPIFDFITVETETKGTEINLMIYDIDGKLVLERKAFTGNQIELAHLSEGQYIIKVYDAESNELGSEQVTIIR